MGKSTKDLEQEDIPLPPDFVDIEKISAVVKESVSQQISKRLNLKPEELAHVMHALNTPLELTMDALEELVDILGDSNELVKSLITQSIDEEYAYINFKAERINPYHEMFKSTEDPAWLSISQSLDTLKKFNTNPHHYLNGSFKNEIGQMSKLMIERTFVKLVQVTSATAAKVVLSEINKFELAQKSGAKPNKPGL